MSRRPNSKQYTVLFEYDPRSGRKTVEQWFAEGQLERDDDLPAVIEYDPVKGVEVAMYWFKSGLMHRDAGPAAVRVDPETGVVWWEVYARDGHCHRDHDLPAQILRHEIHGFDVELTYMQHGNRHRTLRPAVIRFDRETGKHAISEFYIDDVLIEIPIAKHDGPD